MKTINMNKQLSPIILRPDQTKELKCSNCGNVTFTPVTFLREVPALLSHSGKVEVAGMPGYECCRCKKLMEFDQNGVQKTVETVHFLIGLIRKLKNFLRK